MIFNILVKMNSTTINRINVITNHLRAMSSKCDPTELKIDLPDGGHIAGKVWNREGTIPILGLHGWLDNCGTFDTLAPLLPNDYCLVAIDFPGHGRSSRRPPTSFGSHIGLLPIIHRIIHHFNWNKVNLMGHSMGGGAAFIYACTMTDKVDKLILLDAVKPMQVDPEKQPARTEKFLNEMFDFEKKLSTTAPQYSYDEIVERMVRSYSGSLTEESAKILLKRGSNRHDDDTYSFNYDPLLKANNPFSMCHEQQKFYAERIKCEVIILKASLGPLFESKFYYEEILKIVQKKSPKFIFEVIEGTHHGHLNDPVPYSDYIVRFIKGELEKSEDFSLIK